MDACEAVTQGRWHCFPRTRSRGICRHATWEPFVAAAYDGNSRKMSPRAARRREKGLCESRRQTRELKRHATAIRGLRLLRIWERSECVEGFAR